MKSFFFPRNIKNKRCAIHARAAYYYICSETSGETKYRVELKHGSTTRKLKYQNPPKFQFFGTKFCIVAEATATNYLVQSWSQRNLTKNKSANIVLEITATLHTIDRPIQNRFNPSTANLWNATTSAVPPRTLHCPYLNTKVVLQ